MPSSGCAGVGKGVGTERADGWGRGFEDEWHLVFFGSMFTGGVGLVGFWVHVLSSEF